MLHGRPTIFNAFVTAISICFQKTNSTSHGFKTSLFEIAQNSFSNIQKKSYSGSKALKISSFAAAYGASVNFIPFSASNLPISALTATKQRMVTLVIQKKSSSDTTQGSSGSFYYTTQKESAADNFELRN